MSKLTPQEIIDDPRELWMNSPEGYPYAQKISKNDVGGLKSFLINVTPDDFLQEQIRQADHPTIIQQYLENGFTFDEQWFGARLLDWQK